ncbi:MAG: hypothetical protein AAF437_00700 [Pseudomonadota bacterium]
MNNQIHTGTDHPDLESQADMSSTPRFYVDFDHTLLRSNSTQEFLRTARPFALIWPILAVISIGLKLIGASARTRFIWEDALKLRALRLLNPFSLARFRALAPAIAAEQINEDIVDQLASVPREDITIVSFGSHEIISALLSETAFASCEIVAPTIDSGPKDRRLGKMAMLETHGRIPGAEDVLMTDNLEDDADIAAAVGQTVHVEADHDSYAYRQPYIPFFYTAKIKRTPGFFIKQVILEELPIVLLAFGLAAFAWNLSLWACLVLLFLAMILSYELGYAENDRVGEQKETKPKLSKSYFKHRQYRLFPHAWIYALALTVVAFVVLGAQDRALAMSHLGLSTAYPAWQNIAILSAVWMGIMVLARIIFWAFNAAPLVWRVYIYAPLHMVKYLGFLALFPISAAGLILVYAHIVRTWSLYAVRRAGGDIEFLMSQLVRTLFLLFGFAVLAMIDLDLVLNWPAGMMLAFCILRAVPEIFKKGRSTQTRVE